jgi:AraC-like DNA-binding protein
MSERLTEILFIQAMRALVAGTGEGSPDTNGVPLRGWLGALGDPRVGGALLLMHQQAARPWTVAALGSEVGMSRAGFAARFKQLVGMPPLVYLQRWRILSAGKELRGGRRTVASVAAQWGYASESAFSNAFKRVTGVSPTRYRSDPLAAAPPADPPGWPADQFRPHPPPDGRAGFLDA